MKSTKTRLKFNWLAIISDFGLEDDFDTYRWIHSRVSLNRAARSFVVSRHLKFRDNPKYLKGCSFSEVNQDTGADEDGCYDSPSMQEARKRVLGL